MPSTSAFPPEPVTTLTPSLTRALCERTQAVLAYLVKTNSITTYFNESEILSDFRDAIKQNHGSDVAFQTFHDHVPLSIYKHYGPFVDRLLEEPCRLSSVKDLMSPGLPEFIAHSSGTSSGVGKCFPKYRHVEHMSRSTSEVMAASSPPTADGGMNCIIYSLAYKRVIECLDDNGDVKQRMPLCFMAGGTIRMSKKLHVDNDSFHQATKIPNQSSPMGVSFISNYKSFIFMHALFALYEPKVELINTMFSSIFRDFSQTINEQWETLVECIDTGSIPDLAGVDQLKDKLLKFLPPNPARAEQLRQVGRSIQSPGWFTRIWPRLQVVIAISSGPFQMAVPEIQHYIGPDVELHTLGINCSEAFLANAYDPRDPSLYKVIGSDDIVEFLPIDASEDFKYVKQTWNVEAGGKYEVILTTRDGLWRYRLGDVIEVVGFDPRDGYPIVHYLERRGSHMRIANEAVSGQELLDVIHSISDSFGAISEFCVTADYRESSSRYCFFVELQDALGPSPASAPLGIHAYLQQHNEPYRLESRAGKFTHPILRVLPRGTFSEYRDWKTHTTGMAAGQVKLPLVVYNEETRNWLAARAVQDF